MCIIALKPAKVLLTKTQMKTMWDHNPHGAGFMYAEDGKVKIVKGCLTLDELWKSVQAVGPLRKLVLHFRIRTHGAIGAEMTHPFWIRENKLAMVHNGVIRAMVNATTDQESDTAVFARTLSAAYSNPITAIRNEFHRELLESYIGASKMVFMEGDGTTHILNEHMGEWHNNVWYSNDRYKAKSSTYTRSETSYSYDWQKGKFETEEDTKPYAYKVPYKAPPETSVFTQAQTSSKKSDGRSTSENSGRRAIQKPLMGLPSKSSWDRLPFPEEAARNSKSN
jgi:predicted glutamine amidotransferase